MSSYRYPTRGPLVWTRTVGLQGRWMRQVSARDGRITLLRNDGGIFVVVRSRPANPSHATTKPVDKQTNIR